MTDMLKEIEARHLRESDEYYFDEGEDWSANFSAAHEDRAYLLSLLKRRDDEAFALSAGVCQHMGGNEHGNAMCLATGRLIEDMGKRRAEGDGAEIVRELRKAAYDKADLHNSTAPYGMDDMHPTDTLYSRAADYIEAMGGVPAGWKLVPVEPTPEMLSEGRKYATYWDEGDPAECAVETYAAMLAASPTPPTEKDKA